MKKYKPIHPGDILLEDFMKPYDISQNKLARDIDVPPARINSIIKSKRSITTDTALRLARYFGTTPEFWINLQTHYDIRTMQQQMGKNLNNIIRVNHAINMA